MPAVRAFGASVALEDLWGDGYSFCSPPLQQSSHSSAGRVAPARLSCKAILRRWWLFCRCIWLFCGDDGSLADAYGSFADMQCREGRAPLRKHRALFFLHVCHSQVTHNLGALHLHVCRVPYISHISPFAVIYGSFADAYGFFADIYCEDTGLFYGDLELSLFCAFATVESLISWSHCTCMLVV